MRVCETCEQPATPLIRYREYLEEDVWMCKDCYQDLIDRIGLVKKDQ